MATANEMSSLPKSRSSALGSFATALVLLPPPSLQSRVNAMRIANDKSYPRWTAHVTLIFPFVQPDHLHAAIASIRQAISGAQLAPFTLRLDITGQFRQRDYDTVYLGASATGLRELHRLWALLADTVVYRGRPFVPHMTIGQVAHRNEQAQLLHTKAQRLLQGAPLEWIVNSVVVLCKDNKDGGRMKIFDELFLTEPPIAEHNIIASETPLSFHFYSAESSWIPAASRSVLRVSVEDFTVVTYNVLHDPRHLHSSRMSEIASALSGLDADIICLQEVSDELLSSLLEDGPFCSKWTWCNRGHGVPMESERNIVVFSKEHLPFSWRRVVLGGKHKAAAVLCIPLVYPESGDPRSIVLATLHLTAGLRPKHQAAREDEFQVLLQYLQANHLEDEWVIAGDTNFASTIQSPTALAGELLSDVWISHYGPDAMVYDATYDPLRNSLAAQTAREDKSPQRYDRIYVKCGGNLEVRSVSMPRNEASLGTCSDHWPLCAHISLRSHHARTLPTPRGAMPSSVQAYFSQMTPLNADLSPDWELWAYLQVAGVLPNVDHQERKERAIETLCQTVGARREGGEDTSSDAQQSGAGSSQLTAVRLILVPVGSVALGVDFPNSDLDCIVVGNVSAATFWTVTRQRIGAQLRGNDMNERVLLKRFVKDAAVQMMVLDVNGFKVDLQYCPSVTLAESWLPVSAFIDNFEMTLSVTSLRVLNSYRDRLRLQNIIPNLPTFQFALRFIKLFCIRHGIYGSRFGYFGGIHLVILLTRMASETPSAVSATDLVKRFFEFYSAFDWAASAASATSIETAYRRTAHEPMVILSPERPVINVASNATKQNVTTIVQALQYAHKQLSLGTSWCLVCGDHDNVITNFVQQYATFVKIDVNYWGGTGTHARALLGFIESRIVHLLVDLTSAVPGVQVRLWPERLIDSVIDGSARSNVQGFYVLGFDRDPSSQGALVRVLQTFEDMVRGSAKYYDAATAFVSASTCRRESLGSNIQPDIAPWSDGGIDEDTEIPDEDMEEFGDTATELSLPDRFVHHSNASVKKQQKLSKSIFTPHVPASRLRRSSDVYNRLMWDPEWDQNDFLIGYEDRFEGIKEMPLKNWKKDVEDEAFVPFHRVVHFRRKSTGEIIWNRRTKLDLVFGSGNGKSD